MACEVSRMVSAIKSLVVGCELKGQVNDSKLLIGGTMGMRVKVPPDSIAGDADEGTAR